MRKRARGFSLPELLVSTAVLAMLLVIMGQILGGTTRAWSQGRSKILRFAEARQAFETIQQRLSQATLATAWEYRHDPSAPTIPVEYVPASSLVFRCGEARSHFTKGPLGDFHGTGVLFHAPLGRDILAEHERFRGLLSLCGFFVCHGLEDDVPAAARTAGYKTRWRFRLFELCQPASHLVFSDPNAASFTKAQTSTLGARVLAENVFLLVIVPLVAGHSDAATTSPFKASGYEYDSAANDHELPVALRVVMVAMDEDSAGRLRDAGSERELIPGDLFKIATGSADLDRDLKSLREHLDHGLGIRVAYQVFDSTLFLPASRWNA